METKINHLPDPGDIITHVDYQKDKEEGFSYVIFLFESGKKIFLPLDGYYCYDSDFNKVG